MKNLFLNISQHPQENPVLESLFNKVAGPKACNLLKRESNTTVFP